MFSIFYRFWICDYLCIGNTLCKEQFHCVFFAYFRFLARDQYQPRPRNRNQSMERSSSVMQSTTPPMGPQRPTLEVTTRTLEPSLPQVWLPYRGAKNPDDWLTEDSQYLPMDAIWPYRLYFISDQDICGGYFCGLNGENFTLNDRVYVYIVLKQNIALFDFVFKCITNPKLCLLKAIDKQKRIDIAMAILKLP